MFFNATLWNTLSAIRVGYLARHRIVQVPTTTRCLDVLRVLAADGALSSVSVSVDSLGKKTATIELSYISGKPAVRQISAVSRKSNRVYIRAKSLSMLLQTARGAAVVSTSAGIMSGISAVEKNLGGELLVWVNV